MTVYHNVFFPHSVRDKMRFITNKFCSVHFFKYDYVDKIKYLLYKLHEDLEEFLLRSNNNERNKA